MKRKNATRSALFTSIISLLLCVSMLVGTTFAWFTDSVVSGVNTIAAGNLDVELYHGKDANPVDKVDEGTLLFTDVNGNEIENWEPGIVAYSNFKVANVGTLALTYRLHLMFNNMNTVTHEDVVYDLSDVLKVAIVEDGFEGDRSKAHGLKYDYTLDSFYLEGELEGNTTTKTFGVVVYWAPGADDYDNIFNLNNGKTADDGTNTLKVDLGVSLFATQEEYEFDSFDDLYDEAAGKRILAGEVMNYHGDEVIESLNNYGTVNIAEGTVDIDSYALENHGIANLENVVVKAGNTTNYALITRGSDAVMTLDGVTLTSGGGAIGVANGATIIVNSGEYKVDSASTSGRYLIYAEGEGSTAIVNGGTFSWDPADNQKRAYVYASEGTTVIINGGTFGKASTRSGYTAGILGDGEVIIKGGTFGFDPSNWVAPGYKAVKNGSTWTVGPQITDATDLKNALNNNEDVTFVGDFNLSAGESNAYGKTGINVTNGQTIDGNGNTLTVTGANGTWDSAVNITSGTIKNLTIDSGFRGVFVNHNGTAGHVTLDNVIIDGPVYTISCDQGTNSGLTAIDSTFNGWTSYAATIGNVKFEDCSFGEGSGYAFCRPYAPTEFVGCDFEAGFELDARAAVTFENCTIGGVALTAENLATLVTSNIANASVK